MEKPEFAWHYAIRRVFISRIPLPRGRKHQLPKRLRSGIFDYPISFGVACLTLNFWTAAMGNYPIPIPSLQTERLWRFKVGQFVKHFTGSGWAIAC